MPTNALSATVYAILIHYQMFLSIELLYDSGASCAPSTTTNVILIAKLINNPFPKYYHNLFSLITLHWS